MKFSNFILLIVLLLNITSCKSKHKKFIEEFNKEYAEKENLRNARIQAYADSTVSLNFCGIVLGQPFNKTIALAKKEGKIKNVKYEIGENEKAATCKATIFLPNREKGLDVDVKICSFQDTITSFIILSNDYNTYSSIIYLYDVKYKKNYSKEENSSGSESWIWRFKNQTITLSHFYERKEEVYIKNPRMRSPENRYEVKYTNYFKMLSIIYTDLLQTKKVTTYEYKINEQKRIKESHQVALKVKKDSILRAEREKKILEQEI